MHLSAFHIDGFGIYHHQGVTDLPRGLVLFVGENESGKSTLLEFIRTMLFGLPRRGKDRNDYLPLRGGNQGGRLQLILQDGSSYTIERQGRQTAYLATAGRARIQAEPSPQLLGGLERDTFQRVFAVGLEDLQGLDVLSQEGVRNRLFAAGAGLGAGSVPEVMKKLGKEMESLLAQRGQKTINALMLQLKAMETRIQALRNLAAEYAASQQQREQLAVRLKEQRQEAEAGRRQWRWVEQLQQARRPWAEQNLAREKAAELQYAQDFPAHGLERFENLQQELAALRAARESRAGEAAELNEQWRRVAVDEMLLQQREAIEGLVSERERLLAAEEELPQAQGALAQAEADFSRKLRELGPDWDPSRLAQVDTSVAVRQRVQEFGRQLEAAERARERAQAQERAAQEAEAAARQQASAAAAPLESLAPPTISDAAALREKQEAVGRLRTWLPRRDLAATLLQSKTAAREETDARMQALGQQMETPPLVFPRWPAIPVLAAGLAAGGWLTYRQLYLQAGIALGAGLGLAVLFFWLWRRQAWAERGRLAQLQKERERLEQVRNSLEVELGELAGQVEAAARGLQEAGAFLGGEPPRDAGQLEALAAELEQAANLWRRWQELQRDRDRAAAAWQEAAAKLRQAGEETARVVQALAARRQEWSGWLAARGFQDPVRPEGFAAVLQAVEHARSAAQGVADGRRRQEALATYLEAVRTRIRRVLACCGQAPAAGPGGVVELDGLRRALAAALEGKQRQGELKIRLASVSRELEQLSGQIAAKEAQLQELTGEAGAEGEEEFRRLALAHGEWRTQQQHMDASEIALRAIAVTPEAQAALAAELGRRDSLELQAEAERLQNRLKELEEAISRDDQEMGQLSQTLDLMATNEELGRLLFEQRQGQELLAEASRRWATLALCRHLVEQARWVYEQERQPLVIREADRFLHLMAQGRYRLLSSLEEGGIYLEDKKSLRSKAEIHWSAGLKDQVYLAIRLGLAREFGRHAEPLPVILDDVLVKFDPRRRAEAVRVILDLAREQQVLLFSCHPEITAAVLQIRGQSPEPAATVACFQILDGVIQAAGLEQ